MSKVLIIINLTIRNFRIIQIESKKNRKLSERTHSDIWKNRETEYHHSLDLFESDFDNHIKKILKWGKDE